MTQQLNGGDRVSWNTPQGRFLNASIARFLLEDPPVTRSPYLWSGALICAALLAGCASSPQQQQPAPAPQQGSAAVGVWELSNSDEVDAQSTSLELGVVRLECAGGETGVVLEPEVFYEEDRILIRTDVAPLPPAEGYDCQGNDTVPLTVQLSEPVGERELVDAACLEGEAVGTSHCDDQGVRWLPQQEE